MSVSGPAAPDDVAEARGYTQVPLEAPDELLAAVRAAAEESGEKLATWIFKACAARAGVPFTPPRLGRPPKEPAPKKPAGKRGKGR